MKNTLFLYLLVISALLGASAVSATIQQMQQGAIAYYSFDNISTNATHALASAGSNGLRVGTTISSMPGRVGQAMQFNSASGYLYDVLNVTYAAGLTGGITQCAWFEWNASNPSSAGSAVPLNLKTSGTGPTVASSLQAASTTTLLYDTNDGADSNSGAYTVNTSGTNTFHLLCAVRSTAGTHLDIYEDNIAVTGAIVTARNMGTLTTALVWANNANGSGDRNIVIDEVGFFNYSFSASDLGTYWNNGNGTAWPFDNSTVGTTNFSITVADQYDGSLLSSFNASVQFQNGTVINYTTTTSQINTTYALNASQLANITLSSSNYFSKTYTNYNLSAVLAGTLFQAEVHFNATEIISGINNSLFTVTTSTGINSNGSPVLYLKAGTYNFTFNDTGWYNKLGTNIVVAALSNYTTNFSYTNQYFLNITALNSGTGLKENAFTITAKSGLYPTYMTAVATTNGSVQIPWINDTNLNLTLSNATNISAASIVYNTSNFTAPPRYINITLSSFTTNSFLFSVFNESTQTLLTNNVTIQLSGTYAGYNYTTTTGMANATLISPDTYLITVTSSGYTTRQYIKTLTNQTYSNIAIYLLPTGYGTVLISDVDKTYKSLTGYQNSLLRLNASSYNTFEVERCQGDINGQCLVSAQICTTITSDCPFYKVVVYDSSGNLVGDSGLKRLNENVLTLVINNANPISSVLTFFGSAQYLSSINPTTGVVYYYADNNNGLATSFSLVLQRRIGTSYATIETVTTSSVGTIAINTSGTNTSIGDEFIAYAYYTDSNGQIILGDKTSLSPTTAGIGAAKSSAINFVGLGLVMAPLLMFALSPPLAMAGAIAMLFIINFTGLSTFTTTAIGGIIVVFAIVLWRFFK